MSLLDEDRHSLGVPEYEQLVSRLGVEKRPIENDHITDVIDEIDAVPRIGGALLRKFTIEDPDGVFEYVQDTPSASVQNMLHATAFFHDFLRSPELNESIKGLHTEDGFSGAHWDGDANNSIRAQGDAQEFTSYETLYVDGYLAWILARGGAYRSFSGTHAEAKALGRQFDRAVIGGRYEVVHGWRLPEIQWSEWFSWQTLWDETLLLVDEEKHLLWLFMFTTSD